MIQASAEVRSALAPTAKLRVGLNHSNSLLVLKDAASGERRGIAVDLGKELGARLELPVEFVDYPNPAALTEAASNGAWDVAFLGAEPARAQQIEFTPAYLEIEATYLVPAGSPLQSVEEVDRDGVRISVYAKSAYDLFLSRTLKHARLIRSSGIAAATERFVSERLEAMAGLRTRLVIDAEKLPGSRVLDGGFTAIQQAIGLPRGGRNLGADYLRAFVEEIKVSGLVARLIERHGVRGVSVAPLAAAD